MPFRLMSTTPFHCAGVQSSNGPGGLPVPALLKTRSTRPKRSTAAANRASTEAGLPTSVGTASTREPAPDSSATWSSGSGRRPANTTLQPSASRASAAARPMPLPAPVTTAMRLVLSPLIPVLLVSAARLAPFILLPPS
jgi:hypothetical protein